MKSIRIQNLRSLRDTGNIELRSINLLVGRNSSGKSTLLRFFPLLRQSFESRTTAPILWYGRYVDFGSFDEALNKYDNNKEITFQFNINIDRKSLRRNVGWFFDTQFDVTLTISNSDNLTTFTKYCEIKFLDHDIKIEFDNNGLVKDFIVNNQRFADETNELIGSQIGVLLPSITDPADRLAGIRFSTPEEMILVSKVRNILRGFLHRNTRNETIIEMAMRFRISDSNRMLSSMRMMFVDNKSWHDKIKNWDESNQEFVSLKNSIIAMRINSFITIINQYILTVAATSTYITPIRATAERYYRLQELALDEVDFRGENLAMFLRSLNGGERHLFSSWTEEHFGFATNIISSGDHISIKLKETDSELEFNIADVGFGFSQILPILTQLWVLGFRRRKKREFLYENVPIIFTMEQPELHLHPRLQSKLADVFASAVAAAKSIGVELILIIETHSESIINRFGHLLLQEDTNIDNTMINIVIFEKNEENTTSIRIGTYDEDGFLINWPIGFFEPDVE